ncbi:MAG: tagaturonate epimerase family protein [Chloroflexota bacterium]
MEQLLTQYDSSVVEHDGTTYALARTLDGNKYLLVSGNTDGFSGERQDGRLYGPLSAENAAALRARLPWLNPTPLGMQTSFGFGDRIGLATPGHIAALEQVRGDIAPIFAQQSVRENTRIGRTPQQVMDDAMWGIFESGRQSEWGADADHIKEVAHVTPFVQAGYTFYTIDPSDHVDNEAQTDSLETLQQKAKALPWDVLGTTYEAIQADYTPEQIIVGGVLLQFDEETLLRALAKYGKALAYTLTISDEINRQLGDQAFDLEMSIDETETPTSAEEHYFMANELLRRDVPVVSLAPRFVGKFQKGVDYMGDLDEFELELAKHAAVMHSFDRYKLSVHTGSDKFSIYELVNEATGGQAHVKTAGTSYLEALRVISQTNPSLFRQILDLGHERFDHDRKTYFLDCRPENVPTSDQLTDAELPGLLDDFDARQLLHVTFGSALDVYGDELHADLQANEDSYEAALVSHFVRHLQPFTATVVS